MSQGTVCPCGGSKSAPLGVGGGMSPQLAGGSDVGTGVRKETGEEYTCR